MSRAGSFRKQESAPLAGRLTPCRERTFHDAPPLGVPRPDLHNSAPFPIGSDAIAASALGDPWWFLPADGFQVDGRRDLGLPSGSSVVRGSARLLAQLSRARREMSADAPYLSNKTPRSHGLAERDNGWVPPTHVVRDTPARIDERGDTSGMQRLQHRRDRSIAQAHIENGSIDGGALLQMCPRLLHCPERTHHYAFSPRDQLAQISGQDRVVFNDQHPQPAQHGRDPSHRPVNVASESKFQRG